jgi:glyoxylase-like metal-dependent hydrolase (beta-lactamase superfamily II)
MSDRSELTRADWFTTRSVEHGVWAIDDHREDIIYLICGQERCLLIDTGWGVGDLPALVASLSPLPVVVVNSHGHPDHTFGNGQFAEVYISEGDKLFVSDAPSAETRRWIVDNVLPKPLPVDLDPDTWATSAARSVVQIRDGYVFHLGGRTLQAISVPGHSAGSLCFLERQARLLFTGDTLLSGTLWLHLDESVPLGQFHRSLQRLQGFADAFDAILPAHGDLDALPLSKDILTELAAGIELILSGERVGVEEKTFAGDGLRCDFDSCSVLYRPDRL